MQYNVIYRYIHNNYFKLFILLFYIALFNLIFTLFQSRFTLTKAKGFNPPRMFILLIASSSRIISRDSFIKLNAILLIKFALIITYKKCNHPGVYLEEKLH